MKNDKLWYEVNSSKENGVSYSIHNPKSILKYVPKREDLVNEINRDDDYSLLYGTDDVIEKNRNDNGVELPGGYYKYTGESTMGDRPDRLKRVEIRDDMYVQTGKIYTSFMSDLKGFLDSESIFRELNVMYKRGWLFYGKQGEGKTSLIRQVLRNVLPDDAVTVFVDDKYFLNSEVLRHMKTSLSNRLKVFVFEELTEMLESSKEAVLNFADGENSIDKSILIATTNYPERLEMNIVDRPSRFDKLYRIDSPDTQSRLDLWTALFKGTESKEKLSLYVEISKGFSVAAIKETYLFSKIRGISIEESIEYSNQHSKLAKGHFKANGESNLGFTS